MSGTSGSSAGGALSREEMGAIRRQFQTQFAAAPLAFSVDGMTFGYEAPLDYPIPAGSYVEIETVDGVTYLGQIISKAINMREGPELAIDVGDRMDIAAIGTSISQATIRPNLRYLEGDGVLLGKAVDATLVEAAHSDIFQDATLRPAGGELIDAHLAGAAGATRLDIGRATYGAEDSVASLRAGGFNRHTFLCGQSGSGKTYSLGVVLERLLLRTDLRMLVVDPNSDFVRLAQMRAGAESTFGEADRERFQSVASGIRVLRPTPAGAALPLVIEFGDLTRNEQALVLQLDPLDDREEYSSFWRIIDHIGRENVDLGEVLDAAMRDTAVESRQISLRVQNLGVSDWTIWRHRDDQSIISLLDEEWRAMVLDIGTLGLQSEKQVVTLALLSQLWRRRERREPIMIVIDEAHNICPAEPETPLQELLTQYVIRIAAEGRKFGLYLLLSSQRPQKLHPNVLSQCDNLLLMRMNSSADLAHLADLFSFVPRDLLDEASHFRLGEALVAGNVVQTPTFVRFGARLTEEGGSDVPSTWARVSP